MIILGIIILYGIIFFAVRNAVSPLMKKDNGIDLEEERGKIIALKNIGIINNNELNDILKIQEGIHEKKKNTDMYGKQKIILERFKDCGYFELDKYNEKMEKLREYYEIVQE